MNKTLILIPARAGSKRVKNKNIRKVKNKPLIYWTIAYAKKYTNKEDIVVSSNSKIIKEITEKEKINFVKRPLNLSKDKSNVYFAMIHVLKKIEQTKKYDYIALLQPTSPIRPKNLINEGIKILQKNKKFENLVHLEKTHLNIGKVSRFNEWLPINNDKIRTQDIVGQFRPSGCLFLYRRRDIEKYNKFNKRKVFGYISKKTLDTVNIDNEEDFMKLEYLLKNNKSVKKFFTY